MSLVLLRLGDIRPELRNLHDLLNDSVLPSPNLDVEDDEFTIDTENAVIEFQMQHSLKPDGVVGPQTWNALKQSISSSAKIVSGPIIKYNNTNIVRLTANGARVLQDCLRAAGEKSCIVTSTLRTAMDQARVMYSNISEHGCAEQYKLYGSGGDRIVKVYEDNEGKPKDDVIKLMHDKIVATKWGEGKGHRAHGLDRDTFDVAPSSIKHDLKFHKAIKANTEVAVYHAAKVVGGSDPAFHLEVLYTSLTRKDTGKHKAKKLAKAKPKG